MDRRRYRSYALALALLAGACTVAERRVDTVQRKWPATGIDRIELTEVDGSVDVTAGEPNEITLVAHVRSRGFNADPRKENKGYFVTNLDGDTLSIGRRGHRRSHFRLPFFFTNDISVDYELKVPPAVALELRTVNGKIATRGVDGEADINTVNGGIDLETGGTREIAAHTVNGRLKARFLRDFQGAQLKTVNGSVDAVLTASASFICDLSQVNGDFEASFPLTIHSHPGSRRVSGDVNGGRHELRIVTVNGDIRIANGTEATAPSAPEAPAAAPAPPAKPALPAPPPNPSTR